MQYTRRDFLQTTAAACIASGLGAARSAWGQHWTATDKRATLGWAVPQQTGTKIVSVETFRADHMSALGYHRPTTPHLDALSRRGVLFSKAHSPSSWTKASLASLFTGTYPSTHRIEALNKIPKKIGTLAETFRKNGYRCHGFTGWPHLSGLWRRSTAR